MSLTCPNCHYILEIKVAARPAKAPRINRDISPITDVVLADIFGYMLTRGPQEGSTAGLYYDYLTWTSLKKPPTKQAFAIGLGRNGAVRWRTSQARGYTIGQIDPEAKPARMSPEQRERFEAAHQRQGVLEHRGGALEPSHPITALTEPRPGTPDLSALPFEVEGP